MKLPPGVSQANFAEAIKQFEAAIGKEWVFTSDEDVDLYRDAYSPLWHEAEEPIPSAAVAPDGVEQVQAIVRIANKYKIPLWTISTGKNLGYGGSSPLLTGSVVLDLKRMNRVLEVNDKNHFALVEPGVSYFDLYRYIHEKGLKVWIDPPDPGWGSPIGNSLERGGGYTPMRDHFDCHCGMEVVLANGEVVRTGMGALPNSKTWQQYKYGFGPYVDGIFSQSGLGIVTKMGIWLMPEPEAYFSGTVTVAKHDDIFQLVEIFAYLMNSGTVQATTLVTSPLSFARPDAELTALRASPDKQGLDDYAARKNIPYWSVSLPFYGPAKVVAAQWEFAQEKFSSIPGVKFHDGASQRFPLSPDQVAKILDTVPFGIPSLQTFSILGPARPGSFGFFADYPHDRRRRTRVPAGFRAGLPRPWLSWRRCGGVSSFLVFRPGLRDYLPLSDRAGRRKEPQDPRNLQALDQGFRRTTAGESTARTPRSWATSRRRIPSTITHCCGCMKP